jgi:hypothetical protein
MTRAAKVALLRGSVLPPPFSAPRPVTAAQLAHGDLSKVQKAFLLADIFLGRRELIEHSVAGLGRYEQLNPTYIHAALQRMDQREAIEAGILPLIPPPSPAVQAQRRLAKLVRDFGHLWVAEKLAGLAPAAIGEPVNDNLPPREGDVVALPDAAA